MGIGVAHHLCLSFSGTLESGAYLESIPSCALEHLQWCSVCNPAKIFLTSKFHYLLFGNPTHKTVTGTANRWGTTN
jgi:hypothetical protein